MSSYLITGVARGLGFELLKQLSADKANTVIGIVRDKDTAEKKFAAEFDHRTNVHILQVDLTDYAALKENNPEHVESYSLTKDGFLSPESHWDTIGVLGEQPGRFEKDALHAFKVNVLGNIHLFNLFMPLILKGKTKKVLAITSGLADADWTAKYDIDWNAPYAISKAGLNMVVAKFSAQYRKDGVLFMSICPGSVDTGYFDNQKKGKEMAEIFIKHSPSFTGPLKPEVAAEQVLSIFNDGSLAAGSAGAFISKVKQWQ